MKSCIFCEVIAGKHPRTVIFEDESVVVIKDLYPATSLHWLILPKKHSSDIIDLTPEELMKLVVVAQQLIKTHKISDFRIITNGGGAQQIDHTHIHLMGSVNPHRGLV